MVATSSLLTQLMVHPWLTATSLSDPFMVFGKLKTSKERPEDLSLVPLWLFMELEPPFAFSTLKTTRSRNWLWWKLEAKKSGSCQTHTSPSLLKQSFSVSPVRECMITLLCGKFTSNIFALDSVFDTPDAPPLISTSSSWRSRVFTWCSILSCIHQGYHYFTKCAHLLSWSKSSDNLDGSTIEWSIT